MKEMKALAAAQPLITSPNKNSEQVASLAVISLTKSFAYSIPRPTA